MPITDKGLATRNNIIDTACKLFISQCYHATSTRSIAQAAGIAARAMYNHFHRKVVMGKMVPHMHALVNAAKQYKILTIQAAMEGDYHKALEALFAISLENSFKKLRAVLDDLLLAHEAYLPNFKETIKKIKKGERPY